MCVYIYIIDIIYTYIHTYIHTYMHACIHTYIHTYMHTCMHTYIHTCMHACMHAYIHACMHAYIHTCMHACMHTYIHTYIHIMIYDKAPQRSKETKDWAYHGHRSPDLLKPLVHTPSWKTPAPEMVWPRRTWYRRSNRCTRAPHTAYSAYSHTTFEELQACWQVHARRSKDIVLQPSLQNIMLSHVLICKGHTCARCFLHPVKGFNMVQAWIGNARCISVLRTQQRPPWWRGSAPQILVRCLAGQDD